MAEYINKKEALYQICTEKCGNYGYEECAAQKRCIECQIIEDFPAADVAPVVRSQWIDTGEKDEDGNVWFVCKECGHKDLHAPLMEVPHCWYCGARMDETEVTDDKVL